MRGDFSAWNKDRSHNFRGTLHQQGRVLLDRDWNAQTEITGEWQETAARDAFGAGVAAVSADEPLSFKVVNAKVAGDQVKVTINKGHVWADGLLVELAEDAVLRTASYLEPPIQDPAGKVTELPNKLHDAVILETWLEELSPFQNPDLLIEPALGGVDTTERVQTAFRFRLYRKADGDTCDSIIPKLKDDFSANGPKGKLTVELTPTVTIDGDCPMVESGGFTGFEHRLYRIEIADTDPKLSPSKAYFKWSHFNGGLVGTGDFDANKRKVTIHGNKNAIVSSGLNKFYLEALEFDTARGYWRVVYGARATLADDGTIDLPVVAADVFKGKGKITNGKRFFRLWNGIERVDNFTAQKKDLPENLGILIQFEQEGVDKYYTPYDFWTFEVRAGGIGNPLVLINKKTPHGIFYHRVPLANLDWTGSIVKSDDIKDCRRSFQPLTKLDSCCNYTVGDGIRSWGDYDSIQAAINDLPKKKGGRICVLPGKYHENLKIEMDKVTINGCGKESHIIASGKEAAVHILGAGNVTLQGLRITASQKGQGIHLEANVAGKIPQHIVLKELMVNAATRSAVEMDAGRFFSLQNSHILMEDVASPWPGVYITGDDVLVEHNIISVKSKSFQNDVVTVAAGRGGIQLGGGSERVRIIDNLIQGGIGNGVTLGTVEQIDQNGHPVPRVLAWVVDAYDLCDPCAPASVHYPPGGGNGGSTYQPLATLYDIRLERNRILDMGLNGIGVPMFLNLKDQDMFISVDGLDILGNRIRRCLTRELKSIRKEMIDSEGYGGISLADVENLVVHDNVIEDNGPDHRFPICGIFVLHGEGIDISRNRILNNGAKTGEPSTDAQSGRRSGINIVFAATPKAATLLRDDNGGTLYPCQNGVPAVKIHDNTVSQPLGQALSLTALGPVSIEGNQFTSRGVVVDPPRFFTFKPGVVEILNLGLSNELYLQSSSFSGQTMAFTHTTGPITFDEDDVVIPARPGLDDRRLGQYLANGNVMFNDNQCVLDLVETGPTWSLVSIAIFSLDDVAFQNNQCDCNLLDDLLLTHTAFVGMSLRVSGNRFKEGILNCIFSAITLGLFVNMTTNNQATHCLVPLPSPIQKQLPIAPKILNSPNQIMYEVIFKDFSCESLKRIFESH